MTPPISVNHPFTLLAKPAGAACNLACEYCFYLDKQQLYPGSQLRMTGRVLEAYIKQLLESQPGTDVNVAWQGGEPTLMGLDFFKRSVELVKKYRLPGQHVTYSLQTNATRLGDKWCSFFKKNDFLIGLSLDGPADVHDAFRVDKNGRGSFDQVKHSWELLKKHNVDTNILCAVHAANVSLPLKIYRFFRDELRAAFIQFIPIVERLTPDLRLQPEFQVDREVSSLQELRQVSQRSVRAGQYGAFLIDIFEEWVHHDVGTMFVQSFDSALASWCRLPASICIFQEMCGSSLVLEHNGDLYSCDHFVDSGHLLGNILETPLAELAALPRQLQFGRNKLDQLPAFCLACDVRFACHGECPRNRFMNTSACGAQENNEEGLNYLCKDYRLFFHHIDQPMRIMAELLRSGHAPADIMHMLK